MWYILYDEMLSERRRGERNVGRAFFTHRALSTDPRRDGRTWWWNLMVFCSQEFVVALCKYFFVRFFVSTHFMRTQHIYTLIYTVARHGDAHRWFLTSLCPAILRRSRTHSSRSFNHGILVNNRTWTFLTQVHGYILQVVNFYIFYYHSSFF